MYSDITLLFVGICKTFVDICFCSRNTFRLETITDITFYLISISNILCLDTDRNINWPISFSIKIELVHHLSLITESKIKLKFYTVTWFTRLVYRRNKKWSQKYPYNTYLNPCVVGLYPEGICTSYIMSRVRRLDKEVK